MEMNLKLYKKEGTYFSEKDNKDKPFTNFYVSCNGNMIPVEVKYFPNDKFGGRDPGYSARMAVLSAFAESLPEQKKEAKSEGNSVSAKTRPEQKKEAQSESNGASATVDTETGELNFTA